MKTDSTPNRKAHRRPMVLVAMLLAAFTVVGVAKTASADFSPYVNVKSQKLAIPANDCTASAGAKWRSDGKAQGMGKVPCILRHADTGVSVRLQRWNGSTWVPLPWTDYNFDNSLGSGSRELLTTASGQCGNAYWVTEVWASVKTGTQTRTVRFTNDVQQYDPCG